MKTLEFHDTAKNSNFFRLFIFLFIAFMYVVFIAFVANV